VQQNEVPHVGIGEQKRWLVDDVISNGDSFSILVQKNDDKS
jgi:hypothetical protein